MIKYYCEKCCLLFDQSEQCETCGEEHLQAIVISVQYQEANQQY